MAKISNANGPTNNPELAAGGLRDGLDPTGQNANEAEFADHTGDSTHGRPASPLDVPNSTEHPVGERYGDLGPGPVSTTAGSGPDYPGTEAEQAEQEAAEWPAARATAPEWRKALIANGVSEEWADEPDPDEKPGKALTKEQMQAVARALDSGELRLNEDGVPVENEDYHPDAEPVGDEDDQADDGEDAEDAEAEGSARA